MTFAYARTVDWPTSAPSSPTRCSQTRRPVWRCLIGASSSSGRNESEQTRAVRYRASVGFCRGTRRTQFCTPGYPLQWPHTRTQWRSATGERLLCTRRPQGVEIGHRLDTLYTLTRRSGPSSNRIRNTLPDGSPRTSSTLSCSTSDLEPSSARAHNWPLSSHK